MQLQAHSNPEWRKMSKAEAPTPAIGILSKKNPAIGKQRAKDKL
jgi:hypothetical protein